VQFYPIMQSTIYTFMERRNMYYLCPPTRLGHLLVLNGFSVDGWEYRNM